MSRQIIDQEEAEKANLMVNTFWGGKAKGECVQLTAIGQLQDDCFSQMTREEAVKFFEMVLYRLKKQIAEDTGRPPWWQEMAKSEEDMDEFVDTK